MTESARLALTVTKIDMAGTLSEACKRAALQPGGGQESAGNRDRLRVPLWRPCRLKAKQVASLAGTSTATSPPAARPDQEWGPVHQHH